MNNTIFYKKIDHNSLAPVKANETDAGYDIFAHSGPRIVGEKADEFGKHWYSISYIEYGVGLQFEQLKHDNFYNTNFIKIYPRSSISKYNLVIANSTGIIDYSYNLEVLIRFKYIFQPSDLTIDNGGVFVTVNQDKIYQVGNKIAQMIPSIVSDTKFVEVDEISKTSRSGFGSSGK
jgi:dUTPase